jgi:site-specific recombinase XerD
MSFHLYRRHRRDCKAAHPEDSRSGEFEERKKGHRRCACPIFAAAMVKGMRVRKSTLQWEWAEARAVVASWEGRGRANLPEPVKQRTTIESALDDFYARAKGKELENGTLKKYRTFKKQFLEFADSRGLVYTDQLTISEADRFYAQIQGGARSKGNKLGMLRSFVRFGLKRKWISENISEDLEAPKGVSNSANRTPFSDDELERMHKACDQIGPPIPGGPGARPWGGEDVRDFIFLATFTGLRISDICLFDISKRLHGNNVYLRQHKTKQPLETWIPSWLVDRLREREKRFGSMIFLTGSSLNVDTVTEQWRRRMEKVFKLAGPFDERPIVHRFRGTFVRLLLERGVSEQDAALLIGDTVEILRKHYGKWIKSRQLRLSKILQDAFEDRPKLLSIEGGRR